MYLASSSETRPPYRRKNHGVRNGRAMKMTTLVTIKINVRTVNGEKIKPRAMTVPRSFTKHAARIPFPKLVRLNPNSSITAYTTATDVVDNAIPPSQLERTDQCKTYRATADAPKNGRRSQRVRQRALLSTSWRK